MPLEIKLPASTRRVAAEIRRYCIAHPDARDTVEGIAWWVHMQRQEELRNMLSDAICLLVREGVLEKFATRDGSAVYGVRVEQGRTG